MKLLLILLLAYAGIVGLLYLAQTWMVFPGASLPSRPLSGPLEPERVALPSGDAVLHGMLFRAAQEPADLLIGFGGNAQDAEFLAHDLTDDFPDLHVVVFHYRGYGPSTGRPSETAVLADALVIHDAMVQRLAPRRTFALGISLGSSVAAYLSKERPLAGLILVTPFDSVEAIAKEAYFWLPVSLLIKHRFPTIEFMAGNPTPVAVIAAERDHVVRPRRTQALVERLENLVFHETLAHADHNTIGQLPIYEATLRAAFGALDRAARMGSG
jgi:pimeloyl-ACP methyl ester carboxylesterase